MKHQNTSHCSICARIEAINSGQNPRFIAELESGYVCLGDHQLYPGYCLFLSKDHVQELPDLGKERRLLFLWEMSCLAQTILRACSPHKLNYEMLGNQDPHLHWHLFPRYLGDPGLKKPVWQAIERYQQAQSKEMLPKTLSPEDEAMKQTILEALRQTGVSILPVTLF